MSELISVIVPVYNCEKYLAKCLDSLVRQSYKELEVILVDDGSTDASGAKCDDFSAKDERIKVIHKKNAGVSAARNDGIDTATGAYITFVDSDDWLELGAVSALYEALKKDNAEMSTLCTAIIEVEEGFKLPLFTSDRPLELSGPQPALEVSRAFLETEPLLTSVVWGKLYKKELFRDGLRYDINHPFEDTRLLPLVYDRCKTVSCVSGDYYHYLQRPSSTMHRKYDPANKNEYFDSRVFKILFYYHHGLRDASFDFERWQCESNLLTQQLALPTLDKELQEQYWPEYNKRKEWFWAQKWHIHDGRTDLELLQEEIPG